MPSQICLGALLESMRSAWEGPEDPASCAWRFLACVASGDQEERLHRLLSFVEVMRGALVERLGGQEQYRAGDGMVEEASRKRPRCGAEKGRKEDGRSEAEARSAAGVKEEVQPRPPDQSDTAAVAAAEDASVAVHEGMSSAAKGVLLDGDLLGCVWGFVLGGSGRQDACVLGELSLVCRKWREIAARDPWWGDIAQDALPLLWEKEGGSRVANSRGRMAQYGRFLKKQHKLCRELDTGDDYLQGLEAHLEIFDRMDGLQLLSMRGGFTLYQDDDSVIMDFFNDDPPPPCSYAVFSAASRDPLGQFASMGEYVEGGHRDVYPCCLCIRVTLRDMRTGRMALIWEEDKRVKREIDYIEEDNQTMLVMGQWLRQGNLLGRLVRQESAFFHISSVPDQAWDVSQQDRLYYIDTEYGFELQFNRMGGTAHGALTIDQVKAAFQAALTSVHGD